MLNPQDDPIGDSDFFTLQMRTQTLTFQTTFQCKHGVTVELIQEQHWILSPLQNPLPGCPEKVQREARPPLAQSWLLPAHVSHLLSLGSSFPLAPATDLPIGCNLTFCDLTVFSPSINITGSVCESLPSACKQQF